MKESRRGGIWPLSPAWRVVAFLWAIPVILLGCLGAGVFAALGWARPVTSQGAVDVLASGPFARWMADRHWAAFTLGACIWYWTESSCLNRTTRTHEREHVRQYLRWGALLLLAYPAASVWAALNGGHAYYDNVFERAARDAARE